MHCFRTFFIKTFLFVSIILILILGVFSVADGNADPHYLKVTSSLQTSLILGTSKAAQGVQPQVLNKILKRNDIYNFSFTVAHSPYGPIYLARIKEKLKTTSNEGIFIVTVDPYSISSCTEDPNNLKLFRENELFLGDISSVSAKPNFEYLLFHYPHPYIYIVTKKLKYVNDDFVHDNGWEEVNVTMKSTAVEERIQNKIKDYREKLPEYKFSKIRMDYLGRTIQYLESRGSVFIVRLPVSKPFFKMEGVIIPDFDSKMNELSQKYSVPYLNLNDEEVSYKYTDGNHLYKTSGKEVSLKIGRWIRKTLEDKKSKTA